MIASFLTSVFLQFMYADWVLICIVGNFEIPHELMQSTNFDSHWLAIWLKKEPNSTWFDGRFQYIFEFWYLSSEISRFALSHRTCSDSWIFWTYWILSRFLRRTVLNFWRFRVSTFSTFKFGLVNVLSLAVMTQQFCISCLCICVN